MMLYRKAKKTATGSPGRHMYVASAVTSDLKAASTTPISPETGGVIFQASGKGGSSGDHAYDYAIELTRRDLLALCLAAGIEVHGELLPSVQP